MNEPVALAATERAKEFQDKIRAMGIAVPDQIDWAAIDRQIADDEQARKDQIRRAVWLSMVPEDYLDVTLSETFAFFDVAPETAGKIHAWLETGCRTNVCLHGATGAGKTTTAYALGYAIFERGLAPFSITAPDLLDAMRPSGDAKTAAWAMDADVLIVDDMGVEKADTEWCHEAWWRVADYRTREHKPTIMTTNESGATLLDKYGKRVVSRLFNGRTLYVEMVGTDRRRSPLDRSQP